MAYLWLTIKNQKTIMKNYGFYDGPINSKKDDTYWSAVLKVNKKYLPKDKYGKKLYYKATDIVLRNLRQLTNANVKNFELTEFKCGCGGKHCSGYPVVLSKQMLSNLQQVRDKFGPAQVTCGLRCKKYNASLPGSIPQSYHLRGKAVDVDFGKKSDTLNGRRKIMNYFKTLPKYHYTYCDENGTHPNMGDSIHMDVK